MATRWALGTRLTAYFLAVIVVLQLVALGFYQRELGDERTDRVVTARRIGQNAAAAIGAHVQDIESTALAMALALASQPAIDQPSTGQYLGAVLRAQPELRAIFVTDTAGRVIASAATGVGTDLSARPYMQELTRGAETVWSASLAGLESGEITVAYGRRIERSIGQSQASPRGYLIFAFHPDRLLGSLDLALAPDAEITITDTRGFVLYDSRRPDLTARERDLSALEPVRRALAGEVVEIVDVTAPYATERRFGAFVPIRGVGWVLAHTREQAPLEAELRERFIANAAVVTLLLLLAALFVVAVANRLTLPLARLARAAALLAEGRRVPIEPDPGGGVEVSQLSGAMRSMVDAVSRREDELRFLASASEILGGSLNYRATLRAVAHLALGRLADGVSIDVVEGDSLRRIEVAFADPALERFREALMTELAPTLSDERHPVVRTLRTAEPVLVPEITGDTLAALAPDARRLELYRALGARSTMMVPLVVRGTAIGVLILYSRERRYGERELQLAQDLARRAAAAIDNARLFGDVQVQVRTRDEFLSAAAHELKTPLTTIRGFAQLIARASSSGTVDRAELARWSRRIDDATLKMSSTVDDLLDVARLQLDPLLRLERVETDLVALVRDVIAQQEVSADRHRITVEAPERCLGLWDRARIERVVQNLIANAVKYSPAGGEIVARVIDGEAQAVLEVVDVGIGIPAEDLPRIFERFRRGSNVVGVIPGTGIGLSLVRQVVEQHGGTVDVESGSGSTIFRVRLPKRPGQR